MLTPIKSMFDDAKKYVKRKINKIDYRNVDLPEGYESVEKGYRKLRDNMELITAMISQLSHYEFGGSIMKNVAGVSNFMASKSKIGVLKLDDMYTELGLAGEHLAEATENLEFKNASKKFSDAYYEIAEEKLKMNKELKSISARVSEMKKEAKMVDYQRNQVADLRYDLEELIQHGKYTESLRNTMQSEYNMQANAALNKMEDFIGEEGMVTVLKNVAKKHMEFAKKTAQILSKVCE